jgi:sterol desaturase/sphingolipid hydroxylase (fatty acid hydroxylase superfamily)
MPGAPTRRLCGENVTVENFTTTFLQLTAIIWARYFLVAGIFYALLWGRPPEKVRARRLAARRPDFATMRFEVMMSLTSSAIYAVPGAIVFETYKAGGTAIYSQIDGLAGWLYVPASVFFYLALHDAYFYWTHRLMHHPALFKATHLAHHRSRQPTPWAAFSFHPWEAISAAWLLPAAAFLVPIHVGAVMFLLIFMTFCSVSNHAGWEIFPERWMNGAFGRQVITASHHNLHHANYAANFGLYFRFWDRLMGTDKGFATLEAPRGAPQP